MPIHPASTPPCLYPAPFVRSMLISVAQSTPEPPILFSAPTSPLLLQDSPRKAAQPPQAWPDHWCYPRTHSTAPTQIPLPLPSAAPPALLPPRTSHLPRSAPSSVHRFLAAAWRKPPSKLQSLAPPAVASAPVPSPVPAAPVFRSPKRSRAPAAHAKPLGSHLREKTVGPPFLLAPSPAEGAVRNLLIHHHSRIIRVNTFCLRAASSPFPAAPAIPPARATTNNFSSEWPAAPANSQKTAAPQMALLSTSRPDQKKPQFARSSPSCSCDFPRYCLSAPRHHSLREIFPSFHQHRQPAHQAKSRRSPGQHQSSCAKHNLRIRA